jgi:hypothetical protein
MNAKRVSAEALVWQKNLPACTKHSSEGRFGEQISEGGYASAGFAEAVKMPRAEARGASLWG